MGTSSVAVGAPSQCQQVFGLLAGLSEVVFLISDSAILFLFRTFRVVSVINLYNNLEPNILASWEAGWRHHATRAHPQNDIEFVTHPLADLGLQLAVPSKPGKHENMRSSRERWCNKSIAHSVQEGPF
jgi:hypothetical protein